MRLLVGLGNPGERYRGTRHNVGFEVLDLMLSESGASWSRAVDDAVLADVVVARTPVTLLKPLTYMNLSGTAVAREMEARSIPPEDLMVLYDDVALPLGTLRLRERGSDGGHNGLASVIESVGGADVARLRIGIRPEAEPADLVEFVLAPFDDDERPMVDAVVRRAVEATCAVLTDGMTKAMSRFNGPIKSEQTREDELA